MQQVLSFLFFFLPAIFPLGAVCPVTSLRHELPFTPDRAPDQVLGDLLPRVSLEMLTQVPPYVHKFVRTYVPVSSGAVPTIPGT